MFEQTVFFLQMPLKLEGLGNLFPKVGTRLVAADSSRSYDVAFPLCRLSSDPLTSLGGSVFMQTDSVPSRRSFSSWAPWFALSSPRGISSTSYQGSALTRARDARPAFWGLLSPSNSLLLLSLCCVIAQEIHVSFHCEN